MVGGKSMASELQSTAKFLKVKANSDKTHDCFNAV